MKSPTTLLAATAALVVVIAVPAGAQHVTSTSFVNGITVNGNSTDLSTGSTFDRRLGMFSDLYFDPNRGEWWGVSDRGPGGGTLSYETRIQRFSLDVNPVTGAISNFQVKATIKFTDGGAALNGLAPTPGNILGNAFDPEGIVIDPGTGNLLVSDEYGPSLVEFNRSGQVVRRFNTPPNLIPRNGGGTPNYASDAGNTAGKTTNRGFEGLAISPDGQYAYASLQSAMLDEGAGNGLYTRIVKFDMATGNAVAQYAYKLETAAQGRGVSSLVALGNDKFLVLERNNRGVGVGATITPADKAVFEIDLAGATDISGISIPGGLVLPAGVQAVMKGAKVMDLDANTLAALGGKSPEKWEGLTVGPELSPGRYLMLAGTDNDYSVTQNAAGTQFDVWFNFGLADPYTNSIQCPIGLTTGCFQTAGGAAATLTSSYSLLPGVLQAYLADINGYEVATTPEPEAIVLLAIGLGIVGLVRWLRLRPRS